MGKSLITGGHGFIGYYLAKLLLDEGEQVVLFDVAPESRLTKGIRDSVKIVHGDLGDWAQVLDVVKDDEIDCIYHAGALLPPVTEQYPAAAYAVNITGTFNVLEAARLFDVESVMYLSTLATFGRDVPPVVPNDASQRPPNMYGVTKVCSERLGEYYHARFGVNFRGIRFPPIIGMGRFDKAQSAYNYLAIQESAMGRPYTIYVDRSTTIALLYVKDAVLGLVALNKAEEGKLTRRVYNLYGFSATAQELVDTVRRYIPDAKIDFKPDQTMIRAVENLPQKLDDTLARRDWGWSPRYSLDSAVEDFIKEVRANRAISE
ncbi:MAG: NAD-dependent epimerase/dehydratase family protein [Deltaproteobacteria bacterium]|nr:MAG: NAD-dependent epimerase/dehydratase family protein [Deltaproteobacteria bacterium]